MAQTAKPARYHFRGFRFPRKQRPKMPDIVVSLDPRSPIHPSYKDGRRFSGRSTVVQNATKYNSNGSTNIFQEGRSFSRAWRSTATQMTPNKNAAPARMK